MALRFNKAGKNIGIRAQNLGLGVPMPNAGVCPMCGNWDSELNKDGYCRDEECRRGRQLIAYAQGSALLWVDNGESKPTRKEYVDMWVELKKARG